MAYIPLDNNDLEVGKPTKKSLFTRIKDNQTDFNTRIGALETGASKVELFNSEIANLGQYVNGGDLTRIMLFRASRDLTITNVQVYVLSSSTGSLPTGGTLEFDIRVGNTISSMNTVFNIKPTITGLTEGSTNSAVNFITDGELIDQGQFIALDITSLQTNQSRIYVDIYSEVR